MLRRIDVGNPGMMPLIVQRRRRQGTDRVLKRRKTRSRLRRLRLPRITNGFLIRRPVGVRPQRSSQCSQPFRRKYLLHPEKTSPNCSCTHAQDFTTLHIRNTSPGILFKSERLRKKERNKRAGAALVPALGKA